MSGMNEQPLSQKLGKKVRELRKKLGLTQQELAEKASAILPDNDRIYQTDLSSFEKRGEKLSSVDKIGALFSVLGYELGLQENFIRNI